MTKLLVDGKEIDGRKNTRWFRIWRRLTWMARLDIAASVAIAGGLLLWLGWHS